MDNEKGMEYWTNFYNRHQALCQGNDCAVSGQCVMKLWAEEKGKDGELQYNPARMKILNGLAKITLEANSQIENLFGNAIREGKTKLPQGVPTFYLRLFGCPSHKALEIDYGN